MIQQARRGNAGRRVIPPARVGLAGLMLAGALLAGPWTVPEGAAGERTKVTMAQSAPGLSFAPVYLARGRGFFEEEGIQLTWELVRGGAAAAAALVSGDVQAMVSASQDPIQTVEKGLDVLVIGGVSTSLTMNWGVAKKFLAGKPVTVKSPIRDRVQALKGSRIGVASVAGPPTQFGRYVFKLYGLNPERDAEFSVVGMGAARVAALKRGLVDVIIGGIPDAEVTEHEGYGLVWINMAEDAPIFKEFMYETLSMKREFAERQPRVAEGVARALGRANSFILDSLPEAKQVLQKMMPDLAPAVLELAMNNARGAFGRDGRMTETMWRNALTVFQASGLIKKPLSPAEGALWTNRYLRTAP
ncbi:MAG: ABC transporter substrate-binding protein [Deltaproteobacteria bacterium]|nr:ABC transporter substrate-binding protein [Deltaproteobacteria bacterium]